MEPSVYCDEQQTTPLDEGLCTVFWADTQVCPYGLHASVNLLFRPQIVFLAPLIALAYSAPRGTNYVCAARDYSLLALSIGQFVLLRPQIAPLSFAQIRLRSV